MKLLIGVFCLSVVLFAEGVKLKDIKHLAESNNEKIEIINKKDINEYVNKVDTQKKVIQQIVSTEAKVRLEIKPKTLLETVQEGILNINTVNQKVLKTEIIRLAKQDNELDMLFIKNLKINKVELEELKNALMLK